MYIRNQKGMSMVEMIVAAGLWFVMIAGISQVVIQSRRQQRITEVQDVGELLKITLAKYYSEPSNCLSSFGLLGTTSGFSVGPPGTTLPPPAPLVINNFPFKTNAGNFLTLQSGAVLIPNQLTVNKLTVQLKYPMNAAGSKGVATNSIPIWFNGAPAQRNSLVVSADITVNVDGVQKTGIIKSIEVPVIIDSATNTVANCSENVTIQDVCNVTFSTPSPTSGSTTSCQPVRISFRGTFHTREVIGSALQSPCPVSPTSTADTTQPGYCTPGTYWSKDLPTGVAPQCITQGSCSPGYGTYTDASNPPACYPVCLPQGNCPIGQGTYMGTCIDTKCPDQETYVCTCPTTGNVVNCGLPSGPTASPMAPCADPNTMMVDPGGGGMYVCGCPSGSTQYTTGIHDWQQTTAVLCGWSGYGKKTGPVYCPVYTNYRDTFYVCIKTS